MNQNSLDLFRKYELPFKTFFAKDIEHLDQIHDETELIWLMRGSANIICNNQQYRMTSHTMFMINSFEKHSVSTSSDAILIAFRLNKEHLELNNSPFTGMEFETKVYTFDCLVKKYKEIPLMISQLLELLIASTHSQLIRYKIIGYYNILIFELYTLLLRNRYPDVKPKKNSENLKRLNLVIDYVNKNFKYKPSLEELAISLDISKYRLSHFIKENLGICFRDFLNNMRLEYALILLRDGNESINNIALESGFSDIKYLNQMIKRVFNMTALKYRKNYQKISEDINKDSLDLDIFLKELNLCLKEIQYSFQLSSFSLDYSS